MKAGLIPKSIFLFVAAGICEIGGGYLVWLWLRNNKGFLLGIIGGFVLFVYGVVPTFQPAHFGRVYAAYGGVFVVLSLLWGWLIDKRSPDIFDLMGGLMCIVGVAVIMYWPRS
jgi:small multidrug resistance family-3 protein